MEEFETLFAWVALAALVGFIVYLFRLKKRKQRERAAELAGVASNLGLTPGAESHETLGSLLDGMYCYSHGDSRSLENLSAGTIEGVRYWLCDAVGASSHEGGVSREVHTLVAADTAQWDLPRLLARPKGLFTGLFTRHRIDLDSLPQLRDQVVVEADDPVAALALMQGPVGSCIADHPNHALEIRGHVLVCFPGASAGGKTQAQADEITVLFEQARACAKKIGPV